MKNEKVKIVFTDLDRTLLRDDGTFSEPTLQTLQELQDRKIIVVIATGRNIFSAHRVLPNNLPIDYLMFSSGCGIIEWKGGNIIYENHLERLEIERVSHLFTAHRIDFMLHHPIPENHLFCYSRFNPHNEDFERRIDLYKDFAAELQKLPDNASQFVAVLPPRGNVVFEQVKRRIDFLKVIRATSPLDHRSIWLEVFPNNVSKGHSAQWLCARLGIERQNTLGIGNDFNDLDLLEYTAQSCVVANAPQEMQAMYQTVPANQEDGFAKCMEKSIFMNSDKNE